MKVNEDINLSEMDEEKYKHLNALAEITEEIYYATHEE